MSNSVPAKVLVSVNPNKRPPGCHITHAEVFAAMRTICLMLGWDWLNGAGAVGLVSWSQAAAQRTKLAAKAALSPSFQDGDHDESTPRLFDWKSSVFSPF